MTLISILIVLVVIGVVLYLVQTLPIDPTIRTVIRVVVILGACIWLLEVFGIIPATHLGSRIR